MQPSVLFPLPCRFLCPLIAFGGAFRLSGQGLPPRTCQARLPSSAEQPGEVEAGSDGCSRPQPVGVVLRISLSTSLMYSPKVNHPLENVEIILSTSRNMYMWSKLLFYFRLRRQNWKSFTFCGYYQGLGMSCLVVCWQFSLVKEFDLTGRALVTPPGQQRWLPCSQAPAERTRSFTVPQRAQFHSPSPLISRPGPQDCCSLLPSEFKLPRPPLHPWFEYL